MKHFSFLTQPSRTTVEQAEKRRRARRRAQVLALKRRCQWHTKTTMDANAVKGYDAEFWNARFGYDAHQEAYWEKFYNSCKSLAELGKGMKKTFDSLSRAMGRAILPAMSSGLMKMSEYLDTTLLQEWPHPMRVIILQSRQSKSREAKIQRTPHVLRPVLRRWHVIQDNIASYRIELENWRIRRFFLK